MLSEECLPFWLRLKTKDPPDVRTESDVLQLVADTGFGMARAGLDQLANIKIVETGARLMASCIEIADAFDGPLRAHFQESMEMLAGLAEAERTVLGDNAAQWIRFRGRAALDKLAWAAPDYPRAVGDLVFR